MEKYVKWNEFKSMDCEKPKNDASKPDVAKIRPWRVVIKSFFNQQQGEFCMGIRCVCVYSEWNAEVCELKFGVLKDSEAQRH